MTRRRRSPDPQRLDAADVEDRVTRAYERHAAAIAAYALRRTTPSDAGDVVADTFLVAWRRHGEMPGEPDTLPWLYGVARRVLANQRRSRDRRTRLHDRLRNEFVEFDHRGGPADATDQFRHVTAALDHLSDDDAELLRLTAWEGLSPADLATTMRLEPSAVRQRLRRARQRLKKQLAHDTRHVDGFVTDGDDDTIERRLAVANEAHWSVGGGS